MKRVILILLSLFQFTVLLHSADNFNVAVYDDEGCWQDGIIAFEKFLDWKQINHNRINGNDIKTGELTNDKYDIVYFPGGMAYDYFKKIGFGGIKKIRDFVNKGGGYLGICAGAYFASDSVIWEGEKIDAALSLFGGTAIGSLKEIIPWDKYTLTALSIKRTNPISKFLASEYKTLYYGGPAFYARSGVIIDTLATWNVYHNAPAIINFEYGKGRVLLSGAHIENEENSKREGQNFASELNDPDSEWDILWAGVDWLLKQEITHIPLDVKPVQETEACRTVLSNGSITFFFPSEIKAINKIAVYNIRGEKVYEKNPEGTMQKNTFIIAADFLPDGIYLYQIFYGLNSLTGKFFIQK